MEKSIIGAIQTAWAPVGKVAVASRLVEAEGNKIRAAIREWSGKKAKDVILTVGLSGPRREDIVPDVTEQLLDRRLPGVEEAMYLAPRGRPEDLLFRGRAGIRGKALIVNLPSRPVRLKAALTVLAPVLMHAVAKIAGDESECASE